MPRELSDQGIRLAELVPIEGRLYDIDFARCQILGPAVLWIDRTVKMAGCQFGSGEPGDPDYLIWQPPNADATGAVRVSDCTFLQCEFLNVGFTGDADAIKEFREGLE